MNDICNRHFRDYGMTILIVAAVLVIVASVYIQMVQAFLPMAALLLVLHIYLVNKDGNIRWLSGVLSFGFAMSMLSNFFWYLLPDYLAPVLGLNGLVNWYYYYYVTGIFWLIGYSAIAYVLLQMMYSRQWYLERRIDRMITVAAAIAICLAGAYVLLNLDWQSIYLIDIFVLLIFLCLDIIVISTALKMSLSVRGELQYLAMSVMAFFSMNAIADLLFETRWLFMLSTLITVNLERVELSFHIRDLIDITYNISLLIMTGLLFLFVLDPFARRTLDEMRGRLKDTQLFMDDLIAKSPDATCIFDRDGRLVLVNDPFLQIFGLKRRDLDRSFNIFSDIGKKLFNEETYAEILKVRDLDTVIIPKLKIKGIPGGRQETFYLYLKMFPTSGSDGRISNYVMIIEDITVRIEMEMALRQSEEKFRVLAETSPAAICLFRGTQYLYVNPAVERISGYSREEFAKMELWDLLTPEYRKLLKERLTARMNGKPMPSSYELCIVSKNKELKWVSISIGTVSISGEPAFIVSAFEVTERKQAEEALRESQRFQSTLISNLPGMVYRCRNDADWTMEYASEGCGRLTGYEPAEILHNQRVSYNNLIHPDDREYVRHTIQAALDLKTPFQITYRVRTRQGTEKWVWEQGRLVVPGSPEIIEGFITDITDRKQAEEALRESEEKFRVLAETSPAAIIIYQDESIVYVNPAFEKTVGYTLVELLTMKPWDFMHPDYRGLITEKVLLRKQGVPLAEHYDAKILTKDGRELWSSNWTTMTTYMNRPAGMIIAIDITERKRAEEALRESEARYRALIDNSPLGILTYDLEGNITSINPQILEILGSKSPEFTMSVNLLNFEPVIKFRLAEILRDCIITGESRVAEKSYTSHWGKSVYLGLHLTPLRDHAGQIYSVLCVMEDITERKRLEGDLRKAYSSLKEEYERKIDFTNAAAHELRTPLTPIIGYTDILKAEVKDERHRGFLEIIERNALRQKTLVNRMLELASLDAGMAHVNCVELAVRPLVLEIADNYRAVNPHIRVVVPEGLLINTDPDILRHVLDNLASNAVKYSDNDKEVEIRVEEAGDSYRFSVKDHGAGIPKEEWGKIFERFYIVGGDSDSRTSGRSGLGLALVKAYISLIGGNVWLESEPGKGSTFFFTVPKDPSASRQGG